MRLLSNISHLGRKLLGPRLFGDPHTSIHGLRICRIEQMEPRSLMAADIHVASVYYDPASGNDGSPNVIQITWTGGQPGTELKHLEINGSKTGGGPIAVNDMIFDTAPGGLGAYESHPLQIVSHDGFQVTASPVADGSTKVAFDFVGFTSGMKFVFSIDVDQVTYVDPVTGDIETDAVAEGAEFQRSHFDATFTAPHFFDAAASTLFWDAYDQKFATADAAAGSPLDLPPDRYTSTPDQSVLTAGAVQVIPQVPRPSTLAGVVYEDLNLDNMQEPGDTGIGGVNLSLEQFNGTQYVATGKTATTDALGNYKFDAVPPGKYRVVEAQPAGYVSVGATAGKVNGVTDGVVVTPDVIGEIQILGGQDSVHNDFAEAKPVSLCGFVYHDRNNNGLREPGEEGIAGASVTVIPVSTVGVGAVPVQVITAADGSWCALGLNPGQWRVVETTPTGYLDGLDTPGTLGGTAVNPGDEIDGIPLLSGQMGKEYNFGELLPATIAGRVQAAPGGVCKDDGTDPPIAGVVVNLLNGANQTVATTTTDANGEYKFAGLAPFASYSVQLVQPAGYFFQEEHAGNLGGDVSVVNRIANVAVGSGVNAVHYDFCELLPITISGKVEDESTGNCLTTPNLPPISGVTINLLDAHGTVIATTKTDANGAYSFAGLEPGQTYSIQEIQPSGYFDGDEHAGTAGGNVSQANLISQITVGAINATGYDFCELLPATIAGRVQVAPGGVCKDDGTDPPIAGVTINLLDANHQVIATTTTNANGEYKFTGLPPNAKYSVQEIQPLAYFDGEEHAGTSGGDVSTPNLISNFTVGPLNATGYDFCELLPATIAGRVQVAPGGVCKDDGTDPPIAGVTVNLLDANRQVIATTKTDANGEYKFTGLAPNAKYSVQELQPAGYFDGEEHAGTAGGDVVTANLIADVTLGPGVLAIRYDFCELLPVTLSGRVRDESTGDCETTPNAPPIAGVTINLLNISGQVIATTKTDANGAYSFAGLQPGAVYSVQEIQPAGYFDGDEHAGTAGGNVLQPNLISQVTVGAVNATGYDFCELLPSSIAGRVQVAPGGVCKDDGTDPPIAGVVIHLLDAQGNVLQTTVTDADGRYRFTNLPRGVYAIREEQPAGYFDGEDHAGTAGGNALPNLINQITINPGVDATKYDFCELLPAQLCGFVYTDLNNNGLRDAGEVGIAGVQLMLKDANGQLTGATVTTAADGSYCFTGLAPGVYGVGEVQPVGYFDGLDTPGTAGGTAMNPGDMITGATLIPGQHGEEYNFGELPPASLHGHVLVDHNGNCEFDPGDSWLPGVTIQLINDQGAIVGTTLTDGQGQFAFTGLAPGKYSVHELQPVGYFNGVNGAGTAGGTVNGDFINEIFLGPAVNAEDYHFCETPPGSIAGTVFQDGGPIETLPGQTPDVVALRDGVLRPGDARLPGVTLELRNGVTAVPILGSAALPGYYAADQPIRTVTDSSGNYQFVGLPAGNYAVYEIQPKDYIDGLDTPGTLGGIAINPQAHISPQILSELSVNPNGDAIIRIPLFAGQDSVSNNFSEVVTVPPPPPPPLIIYYNPPPYTPPTPTLAPFFTSLQTAPYLPQVPQLLSNNPTYSGSSQVINYTWHLSVVNAGQPRETDLQEAVVRLTSAVPEAVFWKQANLEQAEWTLAAKANAQDAEDARRVLFGMRDGIPVTGDFNGDGVTDIGVYKNGQWFIDLNGNGVWDEGDLWAKLGHSGDRPVTGDWDGDGKTDIGIYGPAWAGDPRAIAREPGLPDSYNRHSDVQKNSPPPPHNAALGVRSLKLTSGGKVRADLIDHVFHYGTPKDFPVVGDWNGDGTDTIAVFHDGSWCRDVNGDGKWTADDANHKFGEPGDLPVAGDFNGDGIDELGVFRDGVWYLDTNGNGTLDAEDQVLHLGGPGDKPVVGDWDGDGRDEPGVYHDGQSIKSAKRE